jgi:hypothetical protein
MSDNKELTAPQDASRINVNERYEVAYWTRKFNVSEDQLRAAVSRAGVSAEAVARALGK